MEGEHEKEEKLREAEGKEGARVKSKERVKSEEEDEEIEEKHEKDDKNDVKGKGKEKVSLCLCQLVVCLQFVWFKTRWISLLSLLLYEYLQHFCRIPPPTLFRL